MSPTARRGWGRADLGLAVPFAAAGAWGVAGHRSGAVVALALGVALLATRVALGDRLHRAVAVVARAAERTLTTLAVAVLWAACVGPAAVWSRLTGQDPVRPALRGWQLRHRARPLSRAFGSSPPPARRPLRTAAGLSAIGAIALVPGAGPPPEAPPTLAGASWWAPPFADQPAGRAVWDEHRTLPASDSDAQLGWRTPDIDLELTNVDALARRTWAPDGAEGGPSVWILGGSTVFGLGQRDEHTIPSELARVAHADGVSLEVTNLGVSGYVAWQEVGLFERLLRSRPAPDIAVFYHRSNDLAVACQRIGAGLDLAEPLTQSALSPRHPLPLAPPVRPGAPCEEVPELTAASLARDMGVPMAEARRVAAVHGVVVLDVWQPDVWTISALSAPRLFAERLGVAPEARAPRRAIIERALDNLTPRPIDLSAALDSPGGTGPEVLFDVVHHTEEGARRVAAQLWPHVRRALAERPG